MHMNIFSTQFFPFPSYISHVVLCPYTQKVRMMAGRRHRKTSKISSVFERRGCFLGNVRNFWINQIFTDCCIWRKTDGCHQRFTISGYPAELQYSIKYYLFRNEAQGRKDIVWCHASFPGRRTGFLYYPQMTK